MDPRLPRDSDHGTGLPRDFEHGTAFLRSRDHKVCFQWVLGHIITEDGDHEKYYPGTTSDVEVDDPALIESAVDRLVHSKPKQKSIFKTIDAKYPGVGALHKFTAAGIVDYPGQVSGFSPDKQLEFVSEIRNLIDADRMDSHTYGRLDPEVQAQCAGAIGVHVIRHSNEANCLFGVAPRVQVMIADDIRVALGQTPELFFNVSTAPEVQELLDDDLSMAKGTVALGRSEIALFRQVNEKAQLNLIDGIREKLRDLIAARTPLGNLNRALTRPSSFSVFYPSVQLELLPEIKMIMKMPVAAVRPTRARFLNGICADVQMKCIPEISTWIQACPELLSNVCLPVQVKLAPMIRQMVQQNPALAAYAKMEDIAKVLERADLVDDVVHSGWVTEKGISPIDVQFRRPDDTADYVDTVKTSDLRRRFAPGELNTVSHLIWRHGGIGQDLAPEDFSDRLPAGAGTQRAGASFVDACVDIGKRPNLE